MIATSRQAVSAFFYKTQLSLLKKKWKNVQQAMKLKMVLCRTIVKGTVAWNVFFVLIQTILYRI
jgi:hypothetical protein